MQRFNLTSVLLIAVLLCVRVTEDFALSKNITSVRNIRSYGATSSSTGERQVTYTLTSNPSNRVTLSSNENVSVLKAAVLILMPGCAWTYEQYCILADLIYKRNTLPATGRAAAIMLNLKEFADAIVRAKISVYSQNFQLLY